MSGILTRPMPASATRQQQGIVDSDIHNALASPADLFPFMAREWQEHLAAWGVRHRHGFHTSFAHPRLQPRLARRDAWPPSGRPPGADLDFLRTHYLDRYNVATAVLSPPHQAEVPPNPGLHDAICRAVNEYQVAEWTSREPRLKTSIIVPAEHADLATAEIERMAPHPDVVQVMIGQRSSEPLGRRRYWNIYAAAQAHALPVALHVGGNAGNPTTGGGWPSYYFEDQMGLSQSSMTVVASLILEGVFEQFPKLKVILIEGGFGWLPALGWRLDLAWRRMRSEVPHVKRPPSEYLREHFWVTTQPVEEPEQPEHLLQTLEWIGIERVLFSTDYPHWDFDAPERAFPATLDPAWRRRIFGENAKELYGLDR